MVSKSSTQYAALYRIPRVPPSTEGLTVHTVVAGSYASNHEVSPIKQSGLSGVQIYTHN